MVVGIILYLQRQLRLTIALVYEQDCGFVHQRFLSPSMPLPSFARGWARRFQYYKHHSTRAQLEADRSANKILES